MRLGKATWVILCLLALLVAFFLKSFAGIKSDTGTVKLDVNSDGLSNAQLDTTGLAIGGNLSAAAKLHVQGNTIITSDLVAGGASGNATLHVAGSMGFGVQAVSDNVTLGTTSSLCLADTTNGNIVVRLPAASAALGRIYKVKKVSTSNVLTLTASSNIDTYESYTFSAGNTASMEVFSNGTQWYVLSESGSDLTGVAALGADWTPSEISSLLWLDASDASTITESSGSVSQWDDKSGNGYNLTQSESGERPTTGTVTINGLNTIDFDGSNDEMYHTTMPLDDPLTIYALGYTDSNGYRIMVNGYSNAHYWLGAGTGVQDYAVFFGNGAAWNDTTTNTPAGSISTASIMGVVNTGGTATPYLNGTAQDTKTGTMAAETGIQIGRYSGGQNWDGPMAEILVFNSAISTEDRQRIEGYLAHKWGVSGNLASDHPYKSVSPKRYPLITSATADDADDNDNVLSAGDNIVLVFDGATNAPTVSTKSDVDALVSFGSNVLGANYTGAWNGAGNTLTITVSDATGANVGIGQTVSILEAGGLTYSGNTLASQATGTLAGDFGDPEWTPGEILTALWLDANDASTITDSSGSVSQWNDKSGNDKHVSNNSNYPATGSQTINSKNVIRFTTDDTLEHGTSPSASIMQNNMVFMLARRHTTHSAYDYVWSLGHNDERLGWNQDSDIYEYKTHTDYDQTSSFLPAVNDVFIAGHYGSKTEDIMEVWLNGTLKDSKSGGSFAETERTANKGITIGGRGQDFADSANVDFGEFIVIEGVRSTVTQQRVEGYLAHKWGLSGNLASTHPYKNEKPMKYPIITSATADDEDDYDGILSAGDNIVIIFDQDTNKPTVTSKANVDALVSFGSNVLGTNYSGAWNASGNELTISITDATGGSAYIGQTISILSSGNLTFSDNTIPSNDSATLAGDFGNPEWTPDQLALELWLDATDSSTITESSGLVTEWRDKSPSGFDLSSSGSQRPTYTASDPAFNNLGSIDFNTNKHLRDTSLTDCIVAWSITVIKFPTSTETSLHAMLEGTALGERFGGLRSNTGVGHWSDVYPTNLWVYGDNLISSRYAITVDSPFGTASNQWPEDIINTQIVAFTTNPDRGSGTPGVTTTSGLTVGNYDAGTGGGKAKQSEVIAVSSIPSLADRERFEGYLAHKYGISSNLISGHPYASLKPMLYPIILSATADDLDNGDNTLSAGDNIVLIFDQVTNTPTVTSKANVDALVSFGSNVLGTDYSGAWNGTGNVLTITVTNAANTNIGIGQTVSILSGGNLTFSDNVVPSIATGTLAGDFGDPNWNPDEQLVLELWLDASDATTITESSGLVTEWRDKSPSGFDLTTTGGREPTYTSSDSAFNNKASIDFDGDKHLRDTSLTDCIVAWSITVIKFPSSTQTDLHGMLEGTALAERIGGLRHNGGVGFWGDVYPTNVWVNGANLIQTQYDASVDDDDGWGTGSTQWPENIINTQIVSFVTNPDRGGGTPGVTTTSGLTIGNYDAGTGGGTAKQSEVIALSYIPNESERQKVEGYLAHKWGLSSNLISTHPYRNNKPMRYPIIVSATADDLDNDDAIVSAGDNIVYVFDGDTNKPTVTSKANVDALLSFGSNVLGADYSGSWNAAGNILTITVSDGTGATVAVGQTVSILSGGNLTFSGNTQPSVSSITLAGDFGNPDWTPADLTTELWLDANDADTITESSGAVSQWDDKSGNNRHVSQGTAGNKPTTGTRTQNGLNVIDFANDWLEVDPYSKSAPFTVFQVATVDVAAQASYILWGDANNSNPSPMFYEYADVYQIYGGGAQPNVSSDTNAHIFRVNYDSSALKVAVDSTESSASATTTNALTGLQIGARNNNSGDSLDGMVAEFVLIDGSVSESERQKLEGYFAHKWGLSGNLDSSHPYKNQKPRRYPIILSATADDADDGDALLTAGDNIVFVFDGDTNKPTVSTKANVDALIDFNSYTLGTNYTGAWNASGNTLTISISDATGGNAVIGQTMTILSAGNLTFSGNTAKSVASTTLAGDFGDPEWTPAEVSTTLWVDASDSSTITESGGSVSQWDDKSGNSNNLTQGTSGHRPTTNSRTINGLNALDFDGTDDALERATGFGNGSGNIGVFSVINLDAYSGYGSEILSQHDNGNNADFIHQVDASGYLKYRKAGGTDLLISGNTIATAYTALTGVIREGNDWDLYIDGKNEDAETDSASIANTYTVAVGSSLDNVTSSSLNGLMGELILINSSVNDNTRQQIEGYLAHKWGASANLASTHPYKNQKPMKYPIIASATADDADNLDGVLSSGDNIVLVFDGATNTPTVTSKANVDALLSFGSNVLGANYIGAWNGTGNVLTITISDATGGDVGVGQTITVLSGGNLTFSGTSVVSIASATITGDFGEIAWTPSEISPQFWVDASEETTITSNGSGGVSQWDDISGNDYHITQGTAANQPTTGTGTINGLNALSFDGSDDYIRRLSLSMDTGVSELYVVFQTDTVAAGAEYIASTMPENSNDGRNRIERNGADLSSTLGQNTTTTATQSSALSVNTTYVASNWGDESANKLYLDGVNTASAGSYLNNTNHTRIQVGGTQWGTNFDGLIGEVVFIRGTNLTSGNRLRMEGYLAHKWGSSANLASDHTYRNHKPMQYPIIVSSTADDADNADGHLSAGDNIVLLFDGATNTPAVSTKANVDALLSFGSNVLGTNYTGAWNGAGNTLTITVSDATGATATIGQTISILSAGNLTFSGNAIKSVATSTLAGDFGDLAWTPSERATEIWLDASDADNITVSSSTVTQWSDKSGNGNHALSVSDDPTYVENDLNGLPGVQFTNTSLRGSNSVTVAYVISVVKADAATWAAWHAIIDRKTGTRMGGIMSSGATGFYAGDGNGELRHNGTVYTAGAVWPTITDSHIRSYVVQGSSPITNSGSYTTGNYDNNAAGGNGTHNEIVVLSTLPSETERLRLEGYIAHKWGLSSGLPSGHLYKNQKPLTAPIIVSATADDNGGSSGVQASDNIVLVFDNVTNQPTVSTKDNVDAVVSFGSSVLGSDYSGAWSGGGNTLTITVNNASGSTIAVGQDLTISTGGNLTFSGNTATSSANLDLGGSFAP